MDTKWKKCKRWIGIITFCLGWGMLLCSLLSGITQLQVLRENVPSITKNDYQNTRNFRNFISGRLESFLGMSTGGPVSGQNIYNSYYYGYDDYVAYADGMYDYTFEIEDKISINEEELEAIAEDLSNIAKSQPNYSVEEWKDILSSYGYDIDYPTDDKTATEYYKKQAEQFHQQIQNDKNLLYIIQYDGQTLFTNAEGTGLSDGESPTLPEGYNFFLSFDGEKTRIIKDGQDIDVYGDGYYRESSDWFVPGYKNFTVDEKTGKAGIVIAAARSPIMYMNGSYSTSGYARADNQLYWIERDMLDAHRSITKLKVLTGIAVALLILSLLLRKDRKEGIRQISRFTGTLWLEVKLLAAVAAASFSIRLCKNMADIILRTIMTFSLDFEEYSYYWPDFVYEMGYSIQSRYLSNIVGAAILIFIVCILIGDIRYNPKFWKHSLLGKLFRLFHTKSLALSIQRQLMYPYIMLMTALSIILIITLAITAQYFMNAFSYFDYERLLPLYIILLAVLLIAMVWTIYFAVKNRRTAQDLGILTEQIAAVKQGDLTHSVPLSEHSPLAKASQDLNEIRQGLNTAVEEQIKSERMKVELVSNVSHDIKTPLTSIISYVDLLNQEEELPEHIQDYVKILDDKSQRLKAMVQDVFEISKAASGQLPVDIELIDLGKLLRQTLADMAEVIQDSSVSMKIDIAESPVMIYADGQRLYRVFQNLIQNALQYSLEGSRVYLTMTCDSRTALTVVKNISRSELRKDVDFAARFTRGDASRTDGGSGLGLSISQSFTEACGGSFRIETDADLFTVVVEFPIVEEYCC